MKTVQVLGHAFDCLPGHVTIAGRGTGHNLRVGAAKLEFIEDLPVPF